MWVRLFESNVNATQTLLWCGVDEDPAKDAPNKRGILIEFLPQDRRMRVTLNEQYHTFYTNPRPGFPDGMPYNVTSDCVCGTTNTTIPVERWFQLSVAIFMNMTSTTGRISIYQSGFLMKECECGVLDKFFRDTCVLGKVREKLNSRS